MSNDLFSSMQAMDQAQIHYGRRRFIAALGVAVVGLAGAGYYLTRPQTYNLRHVGFITPNDEFYKVSVNLFYQPQIDMEAWRLNLKGLDGKSQPLSMEDIRALPNQVVHHTFCCIGNQVGGVDISNAAWRVARLSDLLKPLIPDKIEGIRMLATGLDGFYSSVPLELALTEHSYIAYEMNGVPIPSDHGKPARVIIPGRYGMKQPKWLKSIEVTDRKVTGYWEEQNWSDDAEIKALSRIDRAEHIESAGEDILLAGIAFCGYPPVDTVEVSTDGGKSWQLAELETKPEPHVWTLWKYLWKRPVPGTYTVICRVKDVLGQSQIEKDFGGFPGGITGLHRVKLVVV